ncbi:hypothetical protein ASPZODRAFT_1355993 [Penicilliopsis zonata CBS 506.65]|uniref:RNA polymerase II holoenzyme cyclin-like subunit n=1 Tax=Penicilliopsis zonata CBS 506.65 TaxID=1073090 RepID=A0A1L9SP70_9EURO|nr:hypothetical protein ASPZODRAFT_1355993 [Penicilliopsis zonata CBS 506.65]OJJ48926.1 hypothetical protein ASPZODRAFT_1355993 [Penicilliopsis zonata CBS 506.65]
MIEDEIYRSSSQFRLWSYTESSLRDLRANTNAVASDRVRAALQRARQARQPVNPNGSNAETAIDEKEIECLNPEEELELVRYYCEKTLELGETYKPPLPTNVRATAIQYLRRFYLTNSPMTYHPKSIMACALFLATKTDNYYMSLRQFADGIPGDNTTAEDVIAPEYLIMQGLRFTFDVRHPFRGLEGGIMELQAMAQGLGQPAPHLPQQTPEDLRRALHLIPPNPSASSSSSSSSSLTDRIAHAHHNTRELLKTAAQMTDAYFLYTPSQIWLSALFIADRPLAEFYLFTKIGSPASLPPSTSSSSSSTNPLDALRTKLIHTITSCSALLQAYTSLSTGPEQMKSLKAIAKKLYHCQNPEKVNLAGQKRDSANPSPAASTPAAIAAAGGEGASESEMERIAKKRKLELERKGREANDIFGGELVTERTKERSLQ